MTKQELIKSLKECYSGDPENDHAIADSLLLEYINDDEVTNAFKDIPKWYA